MTQQSHDHNFKNLFLDFPKESLEWLLPQARQNWGEIKNIEFVRQEPRKHRLDESYLSLDMPILFDFEHKQVLLWLVEFQEDKAKFSIYKLLHYTTDMMEAYPKALVIPSVLFTDRKTWRTDVLRKLETILNDKMVLYFEYLFYKIFDFNARDYYYVDNPVVKILLPKMRYDKKDRAEVIREAYNGLYQLASMELFYKYVDFIDMYAQITEKEQEIIYNEMVQHKETVMLAQYIKNKGREEGRQEGTILTIQENIIEILETRFGKIPQTIVDRINKINDLSKLKALLKQAVQIKDIDGSGLLC